MDFIEGLAKSGDKQVIFMVVDRQSKRPPPSHIIYIPGKSSMAAIYLSLRDKDAMICPLKANLADAQARMKLNRNLSPRFYGPYKSYQQCRKMGVYN
ncbi:hypothetical protein WN943_010606 [Citrus x changshan-huyou]